MIVIADASPLIFLAKIRQLELIRVLLTEDVRLPTAVKREVLAGDIDPVERELLVGFMSRCKVVNVSRPKRYARGMSAADNAAVTLAVRSHADVLLCDDRLTRAMAEAEGVRPLGTLGLLLRAVRDRHLSPLAARKHLDTLVASHGFRISVRLYQAALHDLGE